MYAPIGLAMFAKDTVPTFMKMFVARGQTEITQRRKTAGTQAGKYKTIGQMAVKYGGPEVKRQAGRRGRDRPPQGRGDARRPSRPRRPRRPPTAPAPVGTAPTPGAEPRRRRRTPVPATDARRPTARRSARRTGRHGGAADPRLRPPERHPGHRAARGPGPARAARGEGLRARPPGPHHDPRQDRAARAVTR